MDKKVAIITGGTRGIGLGICKMFLKHSYRVALIYQSDTSNANEVSKALASDDVYTIKADITDRDDREALVDDVEAKYGRIDSLINNAGIKRLGRLLDIEEEDYKTVMDCNLHAPIFLSQIFAKRLVAKKQPGSIVNVLSIGAHRAGNLAYCASKAALLSATKSMAHELAKHTIRVNSVSPSGVPTEFNKQSRETNPEAWKKMEEKVPMKRACTTEDVAGAVLYLDSDAASFTTGIDILVDGGCLTR